MTESANVDGPDDGIVLSQFLAGYAPFDTLAVEERERVADAADLVRVADGSEIIDAFVAPTQALYVVVRGAVDIWSEVDLTDDRPDERLGVGGVFGFSALLTQQSIGPRAVAVGPTTIARIPADVARTALASVSGARFLAEQGERRPTGPGPYVTVDDLIVSEPLIVSPSTSLADVARRMTDDDVAYAAVDTADTGDAGDADGRYGLITDTILRRAVLVDDRPASTPVAEVMARPTPTTRLGESAAQALITLFDTHTDYLLVTDDTGQLRGAVNQADFAVSPSTATVALRQQVVQARDVEELVELGRTAPSMVVDLLARGLATSKVLAVYSATIDAVVRRALVLTFAEHPELGVDAFTWLALGSNGRREAVLSSDIDSAVAFDDTLTPADQERYRAVFGEVDALLERAGFGIDGHGATAARSAFSRTNADWRDAARRWLDDPVADQGAIMTSLLVDGRPIHGDPGLSAVSQVFGDLRRHPGTMKLLLQESLSRRARLRSVRDVVARRGGTFDLKTHALTPVVNIARFVALSTGNPEGSTVERLRAAAGSAMLPDDSAGVLVDVFEALQRTRLRLQIAQRRRGAEPRDVVTMRALSPIDRSVVSQAVREVSGVQRRMENLAHYVPTDEWASTERT